MSFQGHCSLLTYTYFASHTQASITGEAVRMARHLGADEVLRLLEEEVSA